MDYLIDTDITIEHLNNDPDALHLLSQLSSAGIAISIVTYMEAYQGVVRSPNPLAAQRMFVAFVSGVPVIPFSLHIARRCSRVREDLRQRGRRVRPRALDLITAATALEHNLTLVTRNKADFSDIAGLTLS
ncbi:MAG TPA: type II toxin-antitoxin system VapC family toxin [Thermomicrobiales bacterium]|jgi:predicted nucleic acid-binding protein